MVKPGYIYHQDTMGNQGIYTLEEMVKENLTLTPYSHAVHYANSVFEGIRAVWDDNKKKLYLITLDEHINRFLRSLKNKFHGNFNLMDLHSDAKDYYDDISFGINKPVYKNGFKFLDLTYEDIKQAILSTVKANVVAGNINPEQGCYVRPIVYRDQIYDDDRNFDPSLGVFSLKHNVVFEIEAFTWGDYLSGNPKVIVYPEGIDTPLRHIKAGGNYAFGGLVKDWAVARGYSEAILTDCSKERNVLEGGGENLFVYIGKNKILTPDKSQSILPGTKRNLVIEISKNLDYPITETKIPLEKFFKAKAAAFSGTATGYVALDRAKDAKTGKKKIFDVGYGSMSKTISEYNRMITGKKVHKNNKELQDKIRTEVPLK